MATAGEVYSYQVVAQDADGDTLNYTLTGPSGMTIDPDTGLVSWPLPVEGTHHVEITVSDGRGGYYIQTIELPAQVAVSNDPPLPDSSPTGPAVAGRLYTYDMDATDPNGDVLTYSLETAPAGMTMDSTTGLLTWSPADADLGDHDVVIVVRDGRGGRLTQSFTLPVVADATNALPEITSTPPSPAVADYPYQYPVVASDADGDPLTFHLDSGPQGMTIDDQTGLIEWTPTFEDADAGKVSFAVSVTDGRSGSYIQSVDLPVIFDPMADDDPVFDSTPTGPAVENHPYEYQVLAHDPNGDPLTLTLDTFPPGMTFDPDTGLVSWTPATGDAGTYSVAITADDQRGGTLTQSFDLDVVAEASANDADPILDSTPTGPAVTNHPYFYQVKAHDPDGDPLTYTLTTGPAGMQIDQQTGLLTWTPTDAQVGTHPVSIDIDDGRGSILTHSFNLDAVAAAQNDPPNITSMHPAGPVGVGLEYRYQVVATDPNGDHLTYSLETAPAGMTIDDETGLLTWTPQAGQEGLHSVNIVVDDGRYGQAFEEFDLTVESTPTDTDPNITSTAPGPAVVGLTYTYQVTAIDADGDPLTFQLDSGPTNMTINSQTGLLTWTPQAADVGTQPAVSITVSDGRNGTDTQPYNLSVEAGAVNDPPKITSDPRRQIQLGRDYVYVVEVSDPNNDPIQLTLEAGPAGMTLDSDKRLLTWTPADGQLGTHSIQLRASDGRGESDLQSFDIDVVTQDDNDPPRITAIPPITATVGQEYRYDAVAVDPEGDAVFWSLAEAPVGMSIGTQSGTVRWTPTDAQVGTQHVVVRVQDTNGGMQLLPYDITVRAGNLPPSILSADVTTAYTDKLYFYSVRAVDPENQPLTFSLPTFPTGMTINSATGLIQWTPDSTQVGTHDVLIRVQDDQGGVKEHPYQVTVVNSTPNHAPVLDADPPRVASVGEHYEYVVKATDPDGDTLNYQLTEFPTGMTLTNGVVAWTPDSSQQGTEWVTLQVTDPGGLGFTYRYPIDVRPPNNPPKVTSDPIKTVTAGRLYRYDIAVDEPDGDPVTFKLSEGPEGMTVDQFGRVSWQTAAADVGDHFVDILVADDRGEIISHSYTLTVAPDVDKPQVNLLVSPNPVDLNGEVTFTAQTTDNVGVVNRTLTVDGQQVALDDQGRATLVMDTAGQITATLTATDAAGNSISQDVTITVHDPNDFAPTLAISTPGQDGTTITAPTDIIGDVTDGESNLEWYTLSYAPLDGSAGFQVINHVENADHSALANVSGGVLGTFDPTLLANGAYILRLEAQDTGGNASFPLDRIVNVEGNLKLGNFRVSFTDLQIPVAGLPITITRTYDTLEAHHDSDFGYGWKLDIGKVGIKTDQDTLGGLGFGNYRAFVDGTRVNVTLPDGTTEGFTFQGVPGHAISRARARLQAGFHSRSRQYDPPQLCPWPRSRSWAANMSRPVDTLIIPPILSSATSTP